MTGDRASRLPRRAGNVSPEEDEAVKAARELYAFLGPIPERDFSYVEQRALTVARALLKEKGQ